MALVLDSNFSSDLKYIPKISSRGDLAKALEVPYEDLCSLLDAQTVGCYTRFRLPKHATSQLGHRKVSKYREIFSPSPILKSIQTKILQYALRLEEEHIHAAVHGFRRGKSPDGLSYSILSNAKPHLQAQVLINLDLQDFFPSIDKKRVFWLFRELGYSTGNAHDLAKLCCVTFEDGSGHLPQGAPSSPALTNLICRSLDDKLQYLSEQKGWAYTRYADDITFSYPVNGTLQGKIALKPVVADFLKSAQQSILTEQFKLNPTKVKVTWWHQRQEVTGIVVNQFPNIARMKLKQFRAVLHKLEQGEQNLHWCGRPVTFDLLHGFASYVAMVNLQKGTAFKDRLTRLREILEN